MTRGTGGDTGNGREGQTDGRGYRGRTGEDTRRDKRTGGDTGDGREVTRGTGDDTGDGRKVTRGTDGRGQGGWTGGDNGDGREGTHEGWTDGRGQGGRESTYGIIQKQFKRKPGSNMYFFKREYV